MKSLELVIAAAAPVLKINKLLDESWCRNVPKHDYRYGPWYRSEFDFLDKKSWTEQGACLYLVQDKTDRTRYVGVSKNRLKDRWRLSPAFDVESSLSLGFRTLFHSQCWRPMTEAFANDEGGFTVLVVFENQLKELDLPLVVNEKGLLTQNLEIEFRQSRAEYFCDWNRI